ncbi:hypothetical protein COCMIDRAFT_38121 [Bipolaris oryzae ATCC 44560]|uniref:Uncharacterized protein n=1 Tax=Bipolaris oryzae ATCC 44560 TaxID=930090 RepID=W6YX74_COCMI|nr:uncharacterized protein COCMIDRAFT_38121 [Bipolaris oryzae ATCC 44560]EUC43997.1 hypothetical protein COCMIDRAFT_38121 [Bipolaris oryzae ATCC 44560]
MMLVPTTKVVALSVAVAVRDTIGATLLTEDGLTGMMRVGKGVSDAGTGVETTGVEVTGADTEPVPAVGVGSSLSVALVEVCGISVGAPLLAEPVGTDVTVGEADVPTAPVPDGVIPEAGGVMLAGAEAVGVRPVEERTSEVGTPDETGVEAGTGTDPVGTVPEEGNTPDDGRISDAKLEAETVGTTIGSLVGMPVPTDEASEETIVGRRLASPEVGTGVGAVEARPVPEGRMPDTSGRMDELTNCSGCTELVAAASEVGIGPEPRG